MRRTQREVKKNLAELARFFCVSFFLKQKLHSLPKISSPYLSKHRHQPTLQLIQKGEN